MRVEGFKVLSVFRCVNATEKSAQVAEILAVLLKKGAVDEDHHGRLLASIIMFCEFLNLRIDRLSCTKFSLNTLV